jgi:hypothetical protein
MVILSAVVTCFKREPMFRHLLAAHSAAIISARALLLDGIAVSLRPSTTQLDESGDIGFQCSLALIVL